MDVIDSRAALFAEIRASMPPIYDCDRWQSWRESIAQVILSYPTLDRRWACVTLVADDLTRALPGLPLAEASRFIAEAVFEAKAIYGDHYERS